MNCLSLFAVDVDGNGGALREYYQFNDVYSYRYPPGTTLSYSVAGTNGLRAGSTSVTVIPNIDSTVKTGTVQALYKNVTSISFWTGNNITANSTAQSRNFCLFFSVPIYTNGFTRFFRTDNDNTSSINSTTDLDDDNDGIADASEYLASYADPLADADGDGYLNYEDATPGAGVPAFTDANGDGINDAYDADRDGIINSVDLDSDNDGIPDLVEAGGVDTNGDGIVDVFGDTDNDGLADVYDSNNGGVAIANLDTDGDGVRNAYDLDSDNDGIPDVVEAGGLDANNDGIIDNYTDSDGDGIADAVDSDFGNDGVAENTGAALMITGTDGNADGRPDTYPRANMDGTGLPNPYDLDADGDGILDTREAGLPDADNNGIADGTLGADGWSDTIDSLPALGLRNTDNRGGANYLDIDSDDDGIVDNIEGQTTGGYIAPAGVDTDRDGIDDAYDNVNTAGTYGGNASNGIAPVNIDGDPLADYIDLDADNDGYGDVVEGHDTNGDNLLNSNAVTKNGVGGTIDSDGDGLLDGWDNNTTAVNPTNNTTPAAYPNVDGGTAERDWREVSDSDRDGISNLVDMDDDNDGVPDNTEYGGVDAYGDQDGDGVINYLDTTPGGSLPAFVDGNNDGINDAYDVDQDGILNSLDLDSDNDGIADIVEAGGLDTNGDGTVDFTGTWAANDTDNDGLFNGYDFGGGGVNIANLDTDGDGIRNAYDLDSDNDGIPDVVEAGGLDANNDGILDGFTDADGDGFAQSVDGDANNDAVAENTAAAMIITGTDANADGRPDSYPRANTDNAGLPNPYDLDADGDGILDTRESGLNFDANNNGIVSDDAGYVGSADGWSNAIDALASLNLTNTDKLGQPDYLDIDSDDDGIKDIVEAQPGQTYTNPANADTDGDGIDNSFDNNSSLHGGNTNNGINPLRSDSDGIPNYLDLDSDNDGIPDVLEQGGVDSNNDGMYDGNADVDGDGFIDAVDPFGNGTFPSLGTALGTALVRTASTRNAHNLPTGYAGNFANLDGTSLINMLDLDADGDGILDSRESGLNADANNNGIISDDAGYVSGADGWSDAIDALASISLPNTDSQANANFLDIDSDDDGITDNVEGQTTSGYLLPAGADDDSDGIDNQYDNNDAAFAGSAANGITPNNHENADQPDYTDLDSDNDSDSDLIEGNDLNADKKANDITPPLSGTDTDGDGLLDFFDQVAGANVTNAGFSGTGSRSPAQMTIGGSPDRDWRNVSFSLSAYTVMPVRFVSVQVQGLSGSANRVTWVVASEVDVAHYLVERSENGVLFSPVGKVAYKKATDINTYSFTDAAPSGKVFYRIRQVDHDGDFLFSSIVWIEVNDGGSSVQVFPNPVSAQSVVRVTAMAAQRISLWLYTIEGRLLHQAVVPVQKGTNNIEMFNGVLLPRGQYLLHTRVDDKTQVLPLIR